MFLSGRTFSNVVHASIRRVMYMHTESHFVLINDDILWLCQEDIKLIEIPGEMVRKII